MGLPDLSASADQTRRSWRDPSAQPASTSLYQLVDDPASLASRMPCWAAVGNWPTASSLASPRCSDRGGDPATRAVLLASVGATQAQGRPMWPQRASADDFRTQPTDVFSYAWPPTI